MSPLRVAGVDACRAGWIACLLPADLGAIEFRTVGTVESLVDMAGGPDIVAVDIPIGLPERIDGSGRACEMAVRPLLGARQSSVFSMPSRPAVMEEEYRRCCDMAFATSHPPRKVSKQGFALFPRIREIDALLIRRPELRTRIFETHPEVSFHEMNGSRPAALPKKIRNRANQAGLDERAALLLAQGLPADLHERMKSPPYGAGADDVLDAAACAWTALRIMRGIASVYPAPPPRDAHGIEMAIRA